MFNGNNLPHELLFIRRQRTTLKNAIENNIIQQFYHVMNKYVQLGYVSRDTSPS